MKISTDRNDIITTFSLGSCVGVTLYDPVRGIGGMLHSLLPQSKMNLKRAEENPFMFVDSGFVTLLKTILQKGSDQKKLICKVAGGGDFIDKKGFFRIGERNITILRKVLWKNKIMIAGKDLGGSIPRTMVLNMQTGETIIRSKGKEYIL